MARRNPPGSRWAPGDGRTLPSQQLQYFRRFRQVPPDPMEHWAGCNRPNVPYGRWRPAAGATRRVRLGREGLVLQWGRGYGDTAEPEPPRYQTLASQHVSPCLG